MTPIAIPAVDLDALCYHHPQRYPFLLESVEQNQNNKYSILFAHPTEQIILNEADDFDFLASLETAVGKPNISSDLPFTGGWFVYLAYEMISQIEPTITLPSSDQPIAIAVKIPTAIIIDHQQQKTYLIDEFDHQQRIKQVLADIDELTPIPPTTINGKLHQEPESKFIKAVNRCRKYIKSGDVFQVNLSRQWQCQLNSPKAPAQIYQALKQTNPAPFSALAQFADFALISSSPERLFSIDGNKIQTRPIAGTRRRAKGSKDQQLKSELKNHPKEQAEHIMLIDLERNDLGKICQNGTISVSEMMSLESYAFVHHLTSNIQGILKPNTTIKHIIRAMFPGGTITGCPKVRCIQIIAELEKTPRQSYTGSLGYISSNGKMDFNILIRTISQQGKNLAFRTGAGIVYDSIPTQELQETNHKANGIIKIIKQGSFK
ncbi:MAG: aminodeoxychorismate synthase component I [Candidatus Thioglobus sp.]|nr:MAG: aminodeoxychorismate synthase component I [Candidatus Thioglobus sp.]